MGDISDDIVNGFYCSNCGEMIDGDSPGYPRSCGCSSYNDHYISMKEKSFKKKKREERRERVKKELYSAKINGIKIFEISPWHIRVSSPKFSKILDIFPTNKKYHHINKDERGEFKDVVKLVKKIMEVE